MLYYLFMSIKLNKYLYNQCGGGAEGGERKTCGVLKDGHGLLLYDDRHNWDTKSIGGHHLMTSLHGLHLDHLHLWVGLLVLL